MSILNSLYLNRTACDILEEMRQADKNKNYSYMAGLIEELQSCCNKMESKLFDIKDLKSIRNEVKKEKEKLEKLKEKTKVLNKDTD